MAGSIDLDAYFNRVQWGGPARPDYATLAGLLAAHTGHIPFGAFDVLLGRPVRLDLDGLQAQLVQAKRGGYCFQHATLLGAVLEQIGFAVTRHSARVILFEPVHQSPRTHMFLTVALDGARYIIDPGFGPFGGRVPLPLDGVGIQPPEQTHRIQQDGAHWTLTVLRGAEEIPGWVSTLEQDHPIDFEMGNHFTATHPDSLFRHRIMASMPKPDGRVSIMNRDVTRVTGGTVTTETLPDRKALRALLATDLGFDLPEAETMRVSSVPGWDEG
jgi:N-hydroxyarylamine O-acetyltransferase